MRKTFFFILKVTLTLLLIGYVIHRIHFGDVANELVNIDIPMLLLAGVILSLQSALSAYRWHVTLVTLGTRAPWKTIFRINWTALFFNQALPASIGGDATRVWFLHRHGHPAMTTVSSILIGHIGMVFGLVLISLWGLAERVIHDQPLGPHLDFLFWFVPLLLLGITLFTAFIATVGIYLPRPIPSLTRHLRTLLSHPKQFLFFMGLSLFNSFLLIVVSYLIGLSLHLPMTWMNFVTLMPLVIFASVLPISIGGWGPREAVTILLFGQLGISSAAAFTLSVLLAICTIVVSLPGAIFYMTGHH